MKSAGADFVFKFVTFQKKEWNFLLRSFNEGEVPPYAVPADEVLEVWKYFRHIADELPEKGADMQQIMNLLKEMKRRLPALREKK